MDGAEPDTPPHAGRMLPGLQPRYTARVQTGLQATWNDRNGDRNEEKQVQQDRGQQDRINRFLERVEGYQMEWIRLEDQTSLLTDEADELLQTAREEVFEITQPRMRAVYLSNQSPRLRVAMEYQENEAFPVNISLEREEHTGYESTTWVTVPLDDNVLHSLRWFLDSLDLTELRDGPPVGFSDSRDMPKRNPFQDLPDLIIPSGFH